MAAVGLRHVLPLPQMQHSVVPMIIDSNLGENAPLYPNEEKIKQMNKLIPPYGERKGWVPRRPEDFGDGGSFPEIHVAQYPLDLGSNSSSTVVGGQIVALTTDASGKVNYDAVLKQGHAKGTIVHTKPSAMKEKDFSEDELMRPDETVEEEVAEKTKKLLDAKLNKKLCNAADAAAATAGSKAKYIRYTPANQNPAHNSGASHRIIRMTEMPRDPFEPPKFKHKKVPRGPADPAVPIMHSPPRKLSKDERDAWNVPPCISNWKNNKGFVIPLDKRLAADGRGLQDVSINNSFANLSEALLIAERNAREEVAKRNAIKKQLEVQKQTQREEELRHVAQQARLQRAQIQKQAEAQETPEEKIERVERERIREERRREREREERLANRGPQAAKKSKLARDMQRDISEKIALGEAVPRTQEVQFDQRLFNQTQGLDSGFGDDEDYNIYDKRLFGGERERALYKAPKQDDVEQYGGASLDSIVNTQRFKPNKDFSGVDRSQPLEPREGPVQFSKDGKDEEPEDEGADNPDTSSRLKSVSGRGGIRSAAEEEEEEEMKKEREARQRDQSNEVDTWGIDQFFHEVKSGKKRTSQSEQVRAGVMHATGGGGGSIDELRSNKSRKIGFQGASEENRSSGRQDERDIDRDRERDRDRNRERDRDRRDRGRERPRDRSDRERDRDRNDRNREWDRDRRDRGRDRDRDD